MGAGAVFFDGSGTQIRHIARSLGNGTSNIAEYAAVVEALKVAREIKQETPDAQFTFKSDSQVIVRQISGEYAVRQDALVPYHREAVKLADELGATFEWMGREGNTVADMLSKTALVLDGEPFDAKTILFRAKEALSLGAEPTFQALLSHIVAAEGDPVRTSLLLYQTKFGLHANSRKSVDDCRAIAVERYGEKRVADFEIAYLAARGPKTKLEMMRFIASGLPLVLAAIKAKQTKLEKAFFQKRPGVGIG